jgi:thioesterase domain-containing protein/aryl carrier-like protein
VIGARGLPRATQPEPVHTVDPVEPGVGVLGETEQWIATVFADVVEVSAVAVTDNFFDVGGTSLSAARAVTRLRRQGIAVELPWVFSDPTPRALAARVASGADAGRVVLTLRAEGSGPALFCVHPAGGLAWMYGGLAPFLPDRPVHALQDPAVVAGEPVPVSIEAYARRYVAEMRAVQPHGPYHLLGWSLGGHIAHAMTEQLEAAGEEVAVLGLLDTWVGDLAVRTTGSAPSDPLDGWRTLFDLGDDVQATTPDEVAAVVRDHIARSGLLPADRVEAIMDSFAGADAIAAGHRPGSVRAPAVVVVATADKSDPGAVAASWEPYCGSVTRVDVDAGHLEMGNANVLAVVALHLRTP